MKRRTLWLGSGLTIAAMAAFVVVPIATAQTDNHRFYA